MPQGPGRLRHHTLGQHHPRQANTPYLEALKQDCADAADNIGEFIIMLSKKLHACLFMPIAEGNYNFNIHYNSLDMGEPYDYDSVMHYAGNAFSKDPKTLKTIVPKDPDVVLDGARELQPSDARQVNKLYACEGVRRRQG
ncbi:zinc metalloproteinase nas-4-like [Eriocheir sinensis]|uniref:zinc metalloproteinase nas-4-like n=1 Tax=Eriocheir sinensis TaxID=95602 RepID=UPI0021C7F7C5|nr:zinc metalloproteinase nas-4-like [Eriocheir sinensis]